MFGRFSGPVNNNHNVSRALNVSSSLDSSIPYQQKTFFFCQLQKLPEEFITRVTVNEREEADEGEDDLLNDDMLGDMKKKIDAGPVRLLLRCQWSCFCIEYFLT